MRLAQDRCERFQLVTWMSGVTDARLKPRQTGRGDLENAAAQIAEGATRKILH